MASEKSRAGYYFLLIVIALYFVVLFIKPDSIVPALNFFVETLVRILPILVSIFVLMAVVNLFVNQKKLVGYLGKNAGFKGWLISIIGGIISTGPIYMWYPLLSQMQKRGVRNGFIAVFLYNRAIKPALLPMIILYFGLKFTIVLAVVMLVASIFNGIIVEKFMEVRA